MPEVRCVGWRLSVGDDPILDVGRHDADGYHWLELTTYHHRIGATVSHISAAELLPWWRDVGTWLAEVVESQEVGT